MRVLMRNLDGIADKLKRGPYAEHAVPPACPWLSTARPGAPLVSNQNGSLKVAAGPGAKPWLWVIQTKTSGQWRTTVVPAHQTKLQLPVGNGLVVRAIDRCGNESPPTRVMP